MIILYRRRHWVTKSFYSIELKKSAIEYHLVEISARHLNLSWLSRVYTVVQTTATALQCVGQFVGFWRRTRCSRVKLWSPEHDAPISAVHRCDFLLYSHGPWKPLSLVVTSRRDCFIPACLSSVSQTSSTCTNPQYRHSVVLMVFLAVWCYNSQLSSPDKYYSFREYAYSSVLLP